MIVDANLLLYAVDDASLFTAPQWNGSVVSLMARLESDFRGSRCLLSCGFPLTLGIENGSAMCSADADFSKFMGVECVNPFA